MFINKQMQPTPSGLIKTNLNWHIKRLKEIAKVINIMSKYRKAVDIKYIKYKILNKKTEHKKM